MNVSIWSEKVGQILYFQLLKYVIFSSFPSFRVFSSYWGEERVLEFHAWTLIMFVLEIFISLLGSSVQIYHHLHAFLIAF